MAGFTFLFAGLGALVAARKGREGPLSAVTSALALMSLGGVFYALGWAERSCFAFAVASLLGVGALLVVLSGAAKLFARAPRAARLAALCVVVLLALSAEVGLALWLRSPGIGPLDENLPAEREP